MASVRRQTYGYLPSLGLRQYEINTAWWQRHVCVWTPCPGLHRNVRRPGIKIGTYWSQVQRL